MEDMKLFEISKHQDRLNALVRKSLEEATDKWGLKVESVRILLS